MYKSFNNLATIGELTELSFDLSGSNVNIAETDGFEQIFNSIFEPGESLTVDDVEVDSFELESFGQASSPIFEAGGAQTFDDAEAAQLFADSVTLDVDGEMTSCCPCVACSGQNDEADFVGVSSFYEGMHVHSHAAPDLSTLTGSEGYQVPTLESTTAGSNLSFVLNDTGGVGVGSQAEAGFLAAIALWTSFIADDIEIRLDVGFTSLGAGILGSAGSTRAVVSYATYRDALIADGTSADDATAIANLEMGDVLEFATQDSTGAFILDDDGSDNNTFLSINVATALALGITIDANGNAIDDGVTPHAMISFNSDFNFDFDPTDGVDAGAIDFVGVAFHEIGHALGFTSGVDVVDTNSTTDLNGFAIFNQLDVFRYSDNAQAQFGAGTRDLGYGGDPFFSIDGGQTNLGFFSSGRNNGDGQQASHWRDGLGLGILDPTSAPAGQANIITELDIRAFDVIGYDRVGETSIPPTDLTEGDDNFTGIADDENINGLGGDDIIDAAGGNDFVFGGAGNDTLLGSAGNDLLFGEADDDTLIGGEGSDSLSGGDGFDTVDYRGALAGVEFSVDAGGTGGEADGDSFSSIEQFYLSEFNDIVAGSDLDEIFFGEDGNDTIFGEIGDDMLFGGAGDDILRGGDDTPITGPIFGDGQIARDAGAGNDSIANALNIDDDYSLDADPNILDATTSPHVTVSATGDETVHFYAFTVYGPNSNVTLDIDFGDTGGAGSFDSFLELFDSAGNSIATNDLFPFPGGAGGSTSNNDAFISFLVANAGTYFVAVSESGGGGIPTDATYELNVSVEDNSISDPDMGDDILNGGSGDDMLFGGFGTDSAEFSGVQANYTVTDNMDGTYTVTDNVGTDGTDTLESIEFLIFSDGTVDIADAVNGGANVINGTSGDDNILFGTSADDIINGLEGEDVIAGLEGNDVLNGGDDDDFLEGGVGADVLNGDAGFDLATYTTSDAAVTVNLATGTASGGHATGDSFTGIEGVSGSAFADTLTGDANGNILSGEGGNDILDGGASDDSAAYLGVLQSDLIVTDNMDGTYTVEDTTGLHGTDTLSNIEFLFFDNDVFVDITTLVSSGPIDGTSGNDNPLNGTSGDDVINGLAGDDNLFGLGGNDTLNGGDGIDRLNGGDGDDILNGGDGNDLFFGGAGADEFNGGAGLDRVFYSDATTGITANFFDPSLNTGDAAGDTYNGIESINGSNFDDVITSGNDNNDLVGLGGDDVLIGAGGRDRLFGGDGNDRLLGGQGNDDLQGNAGIDTYVIQSGAGNDRIFTYEVGIDIIEYNGGPGAFSDLTIEQVGANTRITSIVGSLTLIGITATDITAAAFTFVNPLPDATGVDVTTDLTAGNDVFVGDENDDIVNGLAGNDNIRGGIGDDELIGGEGNDLLNGGLGADILNGGDGTDTVSYSLASTGVTINVVNAALNTGEAAGDTYISIERFTGSNGDDSITSGNADNQLVGLGGDDTLIGAGGNDVLFGGNDDDRLLGGTGDDILHGQQGADTFVFRTNGGNDTITDFEDGVDILEFRDMVDSFSELTITQNGADTVITSANGQVTLTDFDSTLLDASDFAFL